MTGSPGDADELSPVAVVVTPLAAAEVLAGSLRLAGRRLPSGTVVAPTGAGAVVAAAIDPAAAHDLGEAVSRVLGDVPVVLLTRQEGRLSATRWSGGRAGEPLTPGLVMTTMDDAVESLLLGRTTPAEAPGAIEVARIGRWRAARMVAAARRSG
uniref:Uncharacterized protein n=1 Tax=uncultured Nocardioidaceae bacterium TaxID=253824 RepID=A0A6J4LCE1_9ACTN|nr:MAG: hypothetical protein AVDCRST_MAG46-1338 [uncultured Nocardioidaceae bacterium]